MNDKHYYDYIPSPHLEPSTSLIAVTTQHINILIDSKRTPNDVRSTLRSIQRKYTRHLESLSAAFTIELDRVLDEIV
jgi:hypothetical protein